LAYRITPEQVQVVGYVAVPADGAAELLAPLSPRRVARWAQRHGRVMAQAQDASADNAEQVFVMSATISLGALRSQVLMGAGTPGAVFGPRLWSGQRLATGSAVASMVIAVVLGLSWWVPGASNRMAALPVVKAAPVIAAAASAPKAVAVAAVASAPTPAATAVAITAPVDVVAQSGRVALPALSALISDEAKAAARAQRQARLATQPEAGSATKLQQAEATVADKAAAVAPMPSGHAFALSTRPLRTRAEAEQVQAAMSALLRSGAIGTAGKLVKVQTDILPQGEDWRVVGMPFAQRDVAEQARRLLVARGMRVEVVAF
jgi:hypothetical protein